MYVRLNESALMLSVAIYQDRSCKGFAQAFNVVDIIELLIVQEYNFESTRKVLI